MKTKSHNNAVTLILLLNVLALGHSGFVRPPSSWRPSPRWMPVASHLAFTRSSSYDNEDDAFDFSAWSSIQQKKAKQETLNWCQNFVVPHRLCPWAAASVQTKGAIDIRVVVPDSKNQKYDDEYQSLDRLEQAVQVAANDFLLEQKDPNTAITFVVLLSAEANNQQECDTIDFATFYEWFINLEDEWIEQQEDITLAAFHPDWCFASNDEEDKALAFEKKTPYPTVSIVAAQVIDRAGPEATEQIGIDNAQTLSSKPLAQWQALYDQAIRGPSEESD